MKPITYRAEKDLHVAFVDEDGQTVRCGKCHSKLGEMGRLVLDEEGSEDRRLSLLRSTYDPIRARARARILGQSEDLTQHGGVYLTLKEGYIQRKDGLFAPSSQPDHRSHEGRILRLQEEGKLKQAEELWPEGKKLFEGLVLFRFYHNSGAQPTHLKNVISENEVVFDIFGDDAQIAELHEQLSEEWNRERQQDLQNKRRAEILRDSVRYIAEQRNKPHFLQLPPILCDQLPVPATCWKCHEDNVLMKTLATGFKNWEAETLAKSSHL